MCKICKKDDRLFSTHFFTNSNERPKENPNAEKVWKSSGYYVAHWIPLMKSSMNVKKDWRIKNYTVYVLETSEDFGSTTDGCDGLC